MLAVAVYLKDPLCVVKLSPRRSLKFFHSSVLIKTNHYFVSYPVGHLNRKLDYLKINYRLKPLNLVVFLQFT